MVVRFKIQEDIDYKDVEFYIRKLDDGVQLCCSHPEEGISVLVLLKPGEPMLLHDGVRMAGIVVDAEGCIETERQGD